MKAWRSVGGSNKKDMQHNDILNTCRMHFLYHKAKRKKANIIFSISISISISITLTILNSLYANIVGQWQYKARRDNTMCNRRSKEHNRPDLS